MKTKKSQNPVQNQNAAASASASPLPASNAGPEDVAVRAYYIYLNNGGQGGQDEENWFAAESALKNEARAT